MNDQEASDGIAALIGFGLLVLVGAGIYKALKDVAEYKEAQLLNQRQAAELAERMRTYVPPEPTPSCSIHGFDAPLCDWCHECMDCSPGDGQFCYSHVP